MQVHSVVRGARISASKRVKTGLLGATLAVTLAFASTGSYAGCSGSTHTGSSGGGSHSASSGGTHTGSGGTHSSPCPTSGGTTTTAASSLSLTSSAVSLGTVHTGAASTTHTTNTKAAFVSGQKKGTSKLNH